MAGRRSTGVAVGDNQQTRYAGTLWLKNNTALTGYQPINANLTSISQIANNISGVITVVNGVYHASTLALTGDITGSISTTSTVLTLPNIATAGTYTSVTVNAKGQITAGTNPSAATITISGDATGSGTTSIPLTLATVNSNVGTWNSVTVNGKGLVTAASNVKQAPSYQAIVATALQTVFNTTVNTVTNKLQVFNLRTKQIEGTDYTVTGANQITFGSGVTVSNIVEFYSFA